MNVIYNVSIKNKVSSEIEKIRSGFTKVNEKIGKTKLNLNNLSIKNTVSTGLKKISSGFTKVNEAISKTKLNMISLSYVNVRALGESLGDLSNSLNFGNEVISLTDNINRLTKVSPDKLRDLSKEAYRIAEVYGENSNEIVRAANSLTKQLGGSFGDNLKLIESGFRSGANLNNDFLDQLREYPTQMRNIGIGAKQMISILSQANNMGIYNDKGLDTLKEAGLRLREKLNDKAQKEALAGIGLKAEDLFPLVEQNKVFEAIKIISKELDKGTHSVASKQKVIADIFGAAGEDAGIPFITSLHKMESSLDNIANKSSKSTLNMQKMKGISANLKFEIADMTKSFLPFLQSSAQGLSTLTLMRPATKEIGKGFRGVMRIGGKAFGVLIKGAKMFRLSMLLTPVGILSTALVGLTAAAFVFFGRMKKNLTLIDKIKNRAQESIRRERIELDLLAKQLVRTNPKSKERIELSKELNKRYPDLLKNINLETAGVTQLKKAYSKIIESMERKAYAAAYQSQFEDNIKKKVELEQQLSKVRKEESNWFANAAFGGKNLKNKKITVLQSSIKQIDKENKEIIQKKIGKQNGLSKLLGSEEAVVGDKQRLKGELEKNKSLEGYSNSINSGGSSQKIININLGKFFDNLNINSATIERGVTDIEDKITDTFLRILNSANTL